MVKSVAAKPRNHGLHLGRRWVSPLKRKKLGVARVYRDVMELPKGLTTQSFYRSHSIMRSLISFLLLSFHHRAPKHFFVCSGIPVYQKHSNCAKHKEHTNKANKDLIGYVSIYQCSLSNNVSVKASQSDKRKTQIHRHS